MFRKKKEEGLDYTRLNQGIRIGVDLLKIALVLTIIGAITGGLIGLFDFNLVALIFGGAESLFTKIIYIIVGIAGLLDIKVLIELFDENE